jgi:NAD(P)-dependent dehydrogenase (short-subunit alcohol dehydrogenase family)
VPQSQSRKSESPRPSAKQNSSAGSQPDVSASPDDIRGLAVFLASDSSSWITGALIPVDGGNLSMNAGGSVGERRS